MRTSPSTSVLSRRLAAAVVLPGLLTSSLVLIPPAAAGTGANAGICNGVVNQLAHRGTVQENLLKAAAKKNAQRHGICLADAIPAWRIASTAFWEHQWPHLRTRMSPDYAALCEQRAGKAT